MDFSNTCHTDDFMCRLTQMMTDSELAAYVRSVSELMQHEKYEMRSKGESTNERHEHEGN